MPIVLNPEAKKKTEFICPVVELVARSDQKTVWKSEVLFNLGLVYANLSHVGRSQFKKAPNIDHAFSWHDTPQGGDYWEDVHDRLMEQH